MTGRLGNNTVVHFPRGCVHDREAGFGTLKGM